MKGHIIKTDSQFIIDFDGSVGQFHNDPLQIHSDRLNGGDSINLLPLELNIKLLIAALTLRRKDVVASGGKLEEISIESL